MLRLIFTAIVSLLVCTCGVSSTKTNILTDTQTLLDFRVLISGDPQKKLVTWNSFFEPLTCKWSGVHCNANGRVDIVNLTSFGLQGSISPTLGQLDQLTVLDLSVNALSGLIPAELGTLTLLTTLVLSNLFFSNDATIPAAFGGLHSLTTLTMSASNLNGTIPTELGNLAKLTYVDLSKNSLHGSLPASFINLPALTHLDLSYQAPLGLTGPIPPLPADTHSSLTLLDLSGNRLSGSLAPAITKRLTLTFLSLPYNFLTGGIPSEISLLTALTILNLGSNPLGGSIPPSLGLLPNLSNIDFTATGLSGPLPPELATMGNSTSPIYVTLTLAQNELSGLLPPGYGTNPNAYSMDFSENRLSGGIPDSYTATTSPVQYLTLASNNMSGPLPTHLPDSINAFNISGNQFSGPIPSTLFSDNQSSFFKLVMSGNRLSGPLPSSLSRCVSLFSVELQDNLLSGPLPVLDALNSLHNVNLSSNAFNASLPYNLFNWTQEGTSNMGGAGFTYFSTIDLSNNRFEGPLPPNISMMLQPAILNFANNRFSTGLASVLSLTHTLLTLDVSNNQFADNLALLPPPTQLLMQTLLLGGNQLTGNLPGNFTASLPRLKTLDLSENYLSGSIPPSLGGNSSLTYLSLGSNNLTGPFPSSLETLPTLQTLNLSHNSLGGILPDTFAKYSLLTLLDLSANNLSGALPPSLVFLSDLILLDLSRNSFSGSLPPGLAGLAFLLSANFSSNRLSGPIPGGNLTLHTFPSSFQNNSDLCGPPLAICPIHLTAGIIALIAVLGALALLLLLALAVFLFLRQRQFGPDGGKLVLYHKLPCVVTYNDLLVGSNHWGEDKLLGKGGFGSVYRSVMNEIWQHGSQNGVQRDGCCTPDVEIIVGSSHSNPCPPTFAIQHCRVVFRDGETVAAVKRLHSDSSQGQSEVEAETKSLGKLKHKHLATLWGSYSSATECLLIYRLITGGDLDQMLQRKGEDWAGRHKVLRGSAAAIAYLHHDSDTVIIHRDIKPANILIGKEGEAYLADFGLAREKEHDNNTHVSTAMGAGTVGYMAPEYAIDHRMSTKSDVYAFGVVVLEVATGKRPTDKNIGDSGLSSWVSRLLAKNEGVEAIDQTMEYKEEEMIEILGALKVGLMCTSRKAGDRPSMKEVVSLLDHLSMFGGAQAMNTRSWQGAEAPPEYEVATSAEDSMV